VALRRKMVLVTAAVVAVFALMGTGAWANGSSTGHVLPGFLMTATSGPPGTTVGVTSACAPAPGAPAAVFMVSIISTTDSTLDVVNSTVGSGSSITTDVTIPSNWPAGSYTVSASCDDYYNQFAYATQTFIVGTPPTFTAASPPTSGATAHVYSYTFAAGGAPAPTFALAAGAPSWLTIDAATGGLTGTVPSGTSTFSYSVVASNGVQPDATAGPFSVTVPQPVTPAATCASTPGYWIAEANGQVTPFGSAGNYGSLVSLGVTPAKPIVGIAATPDCRGYWLVATDGGLFAFGDAAFYGSMGTTHLNSPVVGMTATPRGGYFEVASDGGLFAFGPGADFAGSMGGQPLAKPVVGMAINPTGGYYEVASDGGVFAFGAPFHGSTGCLSLAMPILAMTASPDTTSVGTGTACGFTGTQAPGGYLFVASDGGVFSFGNAVFNGSLAGKGITDVVGLTNS